MQRKPELCEVLAHESFGMCDYLRRTSPELPLTYETAKNRAGITNRERRVIAVIVLMRKTGMRQRHLLDFRTMASLTVFPQSI